MFASSDVFVIPSFKIIYFGCHTIQFLFELGYGLHVSRLKLILPWKLSTLFEDVIEVVLLRVPRQLHIRGFDFPHGEKNHKQFLITVLVSVVWCGLHGIKLDTFDVSLIHCVVESHTSPRPRPVIYLIPTRRCGARLICFSFQCLAFN